MLVHAAVRTAAAPDIVPASVRELSDRAHAGADAAGDPSAAAQELWRARAELLAWQRTFTQTLCLGEQRSFQVLLDFLIAQLRASGASVTVLPTLRAGVGSVPAEQCRPLARELSLGVAALSLTARRCVTLTPDRGPVLALAAQDERLLCRAGDAALSVHADGRLVLQEHDELFDVAGWQLMIAAVGSRTSVLTRSGTHLLGAEGAAVLSQLMPAAAQVRVDAAGYGAAFGPVLDALRDLARRAAATGEPLRLS